MNGQSSVVRFYVAVDNGVVIGSRSTLRRYPWAVKFKGSRGWFATFHRTLDNAQDAKDGFYLLPRIPRELIETFETKERMPVGATWDASCELRGDVEPDVEEHCQHGQDLEQGVWRNS